MLKAFTFRKTLSAINFQSSQQNLGVMKRIGHFVYFFAFHFEEIAQNRITVIKSIIRTTLYKSHTHYVPGNCENRKIFILKADAVLKPSIPCGEICIQCACRFSIILD